LAWLKSRSGADDDHDRWEAEFRKWRSRRQKLEFQKEAGKLVSREAVEKKMTDLGWMFRDFLRRLPRAIATASFHLKADRDLAIELETEARRVCDDVQRQIFEMLWEGKKKNEPDIDPGQA